MPLSGAPLSFRLRPWWTGALILGLALACYWPALHGGPLWDDQAHLTTPGLQSLAGLRRIWFNLGATQQYYPVLHSAFWLEHRLWGDATLGYHLVNVVLHAAAAGLVAVVLRRLQVPGATVAGLVFVVHPVCVESVAWISEQKNTLSLVFYLSAARAYLRFDEKRGQPGAVPAYLLAYLLFALALLSKSVTATLPAALLVLAWWQRGRLAWRRDLMPLLPWFAIAVASGLFTAWVERHYIIGAETAQFDLTLIHRTLLASRIIWFDLGKLFWPAHLTFFYPHWDVAASAATWTGCLIAVAAVTFGLWRLRTKNRGPLAAWLFFVGSLAPALGFLNIYPFLFSYVADHFQYLACLGVITVATAGAHQLMARLPRGGRSVGWGASVALLATLVMLSRSQSRHYTDVRTLYQTTLEQNPDSWIAHNNLGAELLRSHDESLRDEAAAHFRAALRLRPDYAAAHYNLGDALFRTPGRLAAAVAEYEEALRLRPNYADAQNNLGNALAKIPSRRPEAISHYQAALQLNPDLTEAHFNLGIALMNLPGHAREAAAQFDETLRLDPGRAAAHNNLGMLLSVEPGRAADAIAHYKSAIRLAPDYADAHFNLGNLLQGLPGRLDGAIAQYQEALRLQPDQADIHNNLGGALSKAPGRLTDAIFQFETAVRLEPAYAEAHYNLAVALLRVPGRGREARQHAEEFARLWPDQTQARQMLAQFPPVVP